MIIILERINSIVYYSCKISSCPTKDWCISFATNYQKIRIIQITFGLTFSWSQIVLDDKDTMHANTSRRNWVVTWAVEVVFCQYRDAAMIPP